MTRKLSITVLRKRFRYFQAASHHLRRHRQYAEDFRLIKFFPAEQAGGLAFIKAMAAPYTSLSFMPTGGINPENVKKYLEYDRIFACGGSWMVKGKLITEGRFDEIEKLTREAAEIVKDIRG